ncbi:MAG: pyridoxal-phosphate dependent enzyme [Myxococcota bacterium]|nr:pyridoxal-phosphate dependent enzyme [Myxococcota bacterium]
MPGVTRGDIDAAAERIGADIHRTPVLTSRMLDVRAGRELFFKSEHLQRTGSFKLRGALNAVRCLSDEVASRGVITDSSGNFGQALAAAGAAAGVDVTVVMPSNAPKVKQAAVRGYGGTVVLCPPTLSARKDTVQRLAGSLGATYISSNDHPHIIAGQGTAARELLEQVPRLDAIIASVGGGGLLGGTAVVGASADPPVAIYGAEPRGADDTARSLSAGRHVPAGEHRSVAKGLLVGMGRHPWDIIRRDVADVFVVDDSAIVHAMHLLWERMKQVVEPSAAVSLAAALSGGLPPSARRVGIILSGGNVDLDTLPWQE